VPIGVQIKKVMIKIRGLHKAGWHWDSLRKWLNLKQLRPEFDNFITIKSVFPEWP